MEIQLWREILEPYSLAVDEIKTKLLHIRDEYRKKGEYSPIEDVTGRVKRISSIIEKASRKEFSLSEIEEKMTDIAGIRIICQFAEDIYKVVELLKRRSDMKIVEEHDYVLNAKPSGYRSYHMIIRYRVETVDGPKEISAEIQIRTLAMNFWATVEHSLQYKYNKGIPDNLKVRLSRAADAIVLLDKEMSFVRGEIMDAQNSFNRKANVVADILNNIQNLYQVANMREVVKIQDEFFKVYSAGNLEDIERFGRELDIISEGYKSQSLI